MVERSSSLLSLIGNVLSLKDSGLHADNKECSRHTFVAFIDVGKKNVEENASVISFIQDGTINMERVKTSLLCKTVIYKHDDNIA